MEEIEQVETGLTMEQEKYMFENKIPVKILSELEKAGIRVGIISGISSIVAVASGLGFGIYKIVESLTKEKDIKDEIEEDIKKEKNV